MMSEKDALSLSLFLNTSVDYYLSSFIDSHSSDPTIIRQTAEIICSNKGQTTEQALLHRKSLVSETDSAIRALAEDYRYARFQLSSLYVEGPGSGSPEEFRHTMDSLEEGADAMESALARKSASFNRVNSTQHVTIEELLSSLPESGTLVEYLKMNYIKLKPDSIISHYVVLIADRSRALSIKDLGEADKVDKLVSRYRRHLGELGSLSSGISSKEQDEYISIATQLYKHIWAPVERYIKSNATVFIAPDGELNLVSFAGLVDHRGKFLIEKHPIQCLSAGRDLINLREKGTRGEGLIAFGNPDYNASVAERLSSSSSFATSTTGLSETNRYAVRNVRSGCETLSEMNIEPLFNTGREVESVARYWRHAYQDEKAIVYTGSAASEELFKQQVEGKRAIHLATHGYFLEGECRSDRIAPSNPIMSTSFVGENPLLLSGLFLAGANLHGEGTKETVAEDGVVTALEVSAMDLRGTDLVVLSACETGLGEVKQGEGVYGLRRAFQLAGARTVVSSLWQVPDVETMKIMKELYSQKATTYPELMQKVALKQINELRLRGRPTHPYTWGAFVVTGDWRMR